MERDGGRDDRRKEVWLRQSCCISSCANIVCDSKGALKCKAKDVLDTTFYKSTYSDVARVFGSDVAAIQKHYLYYGLKEGRRPNRTFNPASYLTANPDVARVYGSTSYTGALDHWITYGIRECRKLK